MSQPIMLCGESNSGKSTSLKYLDPSSTFIISCTNKQLQIPGFRKKYKKVNVEDGKLTGNWLISNEYKKIEQILQVISKTRDDIKVIVIDDMNYCLSNATMRDSMVKGYDKFVIQAKEYYDLIQVGNNLRDDITVVFVSHIKNVGTDQDPKYTLYTTGKMLDEKVNLDGLFSYTIYAERYIDEDEESDDNVKYRFRTKTNGNDSCRSVAGCFEQKYIEPNMKLVIDTINKFENGED